MTDFAATSHSLITVMNTCLMRLSRRSEVIPSSSCIPYVSRSHLSHTCIPKAAIGSRQVLPAYKRLQQSSLSQFDDGGLGAERSGRALFAEMRSGGTGSTVSRVAEPKGLENTKGGIATRPGD
jgi:hypothetical protein